MASRKVPTAIRRARSPAPSAIREPMRAPGTTPIASEAKIAQSMCPSAQWTTVPGIAITAIVTSEVPSARFKGIPIHTVKAGTITIPPPTPSRPETNPAPSPTAAYFHPGVRPRTQGVDGSDPRATRTAVPPIRTAVTRSKRCGFTTSVRYAPSTAPPIPGRAAYRSARKLTSPAREYAQAPTIELGNTTGRGVATAWIAVPPRRTFTAGVVTTAPPTPNRPDRTPDTSPTRRPSPKRATVTRGGPEPARAPRARRGRRRAGSPSRAGTTGPLPSRRRGSRRRRRSPASGRSGQPCGRGRLPRRRSSGSGRGPPRRRPRSRSPHAPRGSPRRSRSRPRRARPSAAPTPARPCASAERRAPPGPSHPSARTPRLPRRPRNASPSCVGASRGLPLVWAGRGPDRRVPPELPLGPVGIPHRGARDVPGELGRGGGHRARRDPRHHRGILRTGRRPLAAARRVRRRRGRRGRGQPRVLDRTAVRPRVRRAPRSPLVRHPRAPRARRAVLRTPRRQDRVSRPVRPVRPERRVHRGRDRRGAPAPVCRLGHRPGGGLGGGQRGPGLPPGGELPGLGPLRGPDRAGHPGFPDRWLNVAPQAPKTIQGVAFAGRGRSEPRARRLT